MCVSKKMLNLLRFSKSSINIRLKIYLKSTRKKNRKKKILKEQKGIKLSGGAQDGSIGRS